LPLEYGVWHLNLTRKIFDLLAFGGLKVREIEWMGDGSGWLCCK